MDSHTELNDLLEKAKWAEKKSIEKSDILLQALRLAERLQDVKKVDHIRNEYFDCLFALDRHAEAFPHFALMVNRLDDQENPVHFFEQMSILWKYKWFMSALPKFPNVPKEQILALMDDMERRYLAYNPATQTTLYYYRKKLYSTMGDIETASLYEAKYEASEPSNSTFASLSDCSACMLNAKVASALHKGKWAEAIELAQPILLGEKSCESIPQTTYFIVAQAFAKLGQLEEAAEYYEKGVQLLNEERPELTDHLRSICYLVLTRQWDRAVAIFEKNFPKTIGNLNKLESFHFYYASLFLFRHLQGQQDTIALQIPENPLLHASDGQYAISTVLHALEREVADIATLFDQRNGNDYYSRFGGKQYEVLLGA